MSSLIEKWLATRPESVQKLAKEFPLGTSFTDPKGARMWLIGYTEDDLLVCSSVNPFENYEEAMKEENKFYAHAQCIRDAVVSRSKQTDVAGPVH